MTVRAYPAAKSLVKNRIPAGRTEPAFSASSALRMIFFKEGQWGYRIGCSAPLFFKEGQGEIIQVAGHLADKLANSGCSKSSSCEASRSEE